MAYVRLAGPSGRQLTAACRSRAPTFLCSASSRSSTFNYVDVLHEGCFSQQQRLQTRVQQQQRHYASVGGTVKKAGAGWFRRKLYTVLAVAGLSGGVLVYGYSQMKSTVESLSWVERLYPSNIGQSVAGGLDSLSNWLKSAKSSESSSGETRQQQQKQRSSSSRTSSFPPPPSVNTAKDRLLTSEIKELQAKIQALEKENHELKQELAKSAGVDPSKIRTRRTQSLIEMYTDVLNLLTDFESKSSRKDGFVNTLPQVVVVGDQSAGKTSVLEMVANARIFPRGGGEMMTRSPVMVTLSEGPEHIAMFRDSNKVYDLSKEQDLDSLRKEIETQMRKSVDGGKTVSSQPISLTVYGPQLKRMVLVDLPGIISTVTTGMAVTTREEIIKMARHFMQNPNAIIMCIQDGSVDAERSIVTDLVSQMDPEGQRTIFVLTKVDLAEKNGMKQDRMLSILDGRLFPMRALGYFAVVTGKGNTGSDIDEIQIYEREYFAKSKLFQNGMLRESQLSTRNMVNGVTEEFWKMVRESINEQAINFKTLRYNLEAEWRNRFPGGRTLDRDDLFELCKADILNMVASLQTLQPTKWEGLLMDTLWVTMAPKVLEIFMEASQGRSPGEFNTAVDIRLHKWADSLSLGKLCAEVGTDTMFSKLHSKLEASAEGSDRFHSLSQGLREEIERLSKEQHQWESYNVDQLKYVQMSALDDKDVPSAEQWQSAVKFMTSAVQKEIRSANEELDKLVGPKSFYDRWLRWRSQSEVEAKRQAIAEELTKFLNAEPSHPNKLYTDEILTVQRVLKNRGFEVSENEVVYTWKYVYNVHFLKQAEQTAQKCQRGYVLRQHSSEYSCPEVEFFWRVQQVMKSSSHTLRVQILDREVRQLEQRVKSILDSIAVSDDRKRELIRGDAVDKAEQLKQVRMIQEKLDAFKEALSSQQNRL